MTPYRETSVRSAGANEKELTVGSLVNRATVTSDGEGDKDDSLGGIAEDEIVERPGGVSFAVDWFDETVQEIFFHRRRAVCRPRPLAHLLASPPPSGVRRLHTRPRSPLLLLDHNDMGLGFLENGEPWSKRGRGVEVGAAGIDEGSTALRSGGEMASESDREGRGLMGVLKLARSRPKLLFAWIRVVGKGGGEGERGRSRGFVAAEDGGVYGGSELVDSADHLCLVRERVKGVRFDGNIAGCNLADVGLRRNHDEIASLAIAELGREVLLLFSSSHPTKFRLDERPERSARLPKGRTGCLGLEEAVAEAGPPLSVGGVQL